VQAFFAKLAEEQGQSLEQFEAHFFESARPTSILKRLIDPTEVAAVVAFVCSPQAAAINGADIRAEGGVVRCLG
jgi:NAD(P)-dependent dehydrogenase (short-subunit alcohol dehydrogenase family)